MKTEKSLPPHSEGQLTARSDPDHDLSRLGARQHGVVASRQLRDLGITPAMIERRLARRRLIRVHRGVYAVGHTAISDQGRIMAAVLAGGRGAVASHLAAGFLLGMTRTVPSPIDVTRRGKGVHRPGIRIHTSKLDPHDRTTRANVPTTAPLRTIVDLADLVPAGALERVVHEGQVQRLFTARSLRTYVDERQGFRGRRALMSVLGPGEDELPTRSELEDRFLHFLRDHRLPLPETCVRLGLGSTRIEVDCLWREPRLVVELDGIRFHSTPQAHERDARRDRVLAAFDYVVIRVRWRHLDDPGTLADDLRRTIAVRASDTKNHRDVASPS